MASAAAATLIVAVDCSVVRCCVLERLKQANERQSQMADGQSVSTWSSRARIKSTSRIFSIGFFLPLTASFLFNEPSSTMSLTAYSKAASYAHWIVAVPLIGCVGTGVYCAVYYSGFDVQASKLKDLGCWNSHRHIGTHHLYITHVPHVQASKLKDLGCWNSHRHHPSPSTNCPSPSHILNISSLCIQS